MRLVTYKAYSGERVQTAGLVLIMPRPSNTQYLADTASTIKEAREKQTAPTSMPLFKLDELQAISTYWNERSPRGSPRPDRGCRVRRTLHRVASRQLGLGSAQSVP